MKMNKKCKLVFAAVPAGARDQIDAALLGNPEEGQPGLLVSAPLPGHSNFAIPMNASGSPDDPIEFYGCCAPIGPQTEAALPLLANQFGAIYYPPVDPALWNPKSTWKDIESDHGLKRVSTNRDGSVSKPELFVVKTSLIRLIGRKLIFWRGR